MLRDGELSSGHNRHVQCRPFTIGVAGIILFSGLLFTGLPLASAQSFDPIIQPPIVQPPPVQSRIVQQAPPVSTTKTTLSEVDRVLNLAVPRTLDDLEVLEKESIENVRRVMAATVAVSLGPAQASGVIVSADGYVLTASHVAGRPGQNVWITFADGRRVRGTTLGSNPDVDGAMIRIVEPGVWPYVAISKSGPPPRGTWCMAVGHPGGVKRGRTPPVRVGRVLQADKYVIKTDCPISGGDSGGPLFDMYGQVIGIHSRISRSLTDNLHVPAQTYLDTWETLVNSGIGRIRPRSQFLAMFDADQNDTIELSEISDSTHRGIYNKMALKFDFDPNQPQTIETLRKKLRLNIAPDVPNLVRQPGTVFEVGTRNAPQLISSNYTRGEQVLSAFKTASMKVKRGTVEVWSKGKIVALGTVIDTRGRILTKASELPRVNGEMPKLKCRLYDKSFVDAEFVNEDNDYDMALLKISSRKVRAIKWKDDKLTTGQWLVSVGRSGYPHSVGVVSVLGRTIRDTRGFMGIARGESADPYGGATVGSFWEHSPAAASNIKPGDVIVAINDSRVSNFSTMKNLVQQYNAGDYIKIKLKREGKERTTYMQLGNQNNIQMQQKDDEAFKGAQALNGPVNERRSGFDVVIQHDSVMSPARCGGPVVDLSGKLVGINIARVERTASYMIPSRKLKSIITRLKD